MAKFKEGDIVLTPFGKGKVIETDSGVFYDATLVYHYDWSEGHNADMGNTHKKYSFHGGHCWFFNDDDDLTQFNFKKSDLQFADALTLRNGDRYVYAGGRMHGEDSSLISVTLNVCYNNDLIQRGNNKDEDIIKIERAGQVIWERQEKKKVKSKFKVGNIVIGNDRANKFYIVTRKGYKGKVTKIFKNGKIELDGEWCVRSDCFNKYIGKTNDTDIEEMTLSQLCKELGREIKIVKERK